MKGDLMPIVSKRMQLVGLLLGTMFAVLPMTAAAASGATGTGAGLATERTLSCGLDSQSTAGVGKAQALGKIYGPVAGEEAAFFGAACGATSGPAFLVEFWNSGLTGFGCQGFGTYHLTKTSITVSVSNPRCNAGNRIAPAHTMSASFTRLAAHMDLVVFMLK
jgi:hypothetical protein